MTDLTPERLKGGFSIDYWRGALEAAFQECAKIERALGLPPEVHTMIYYRLKQWESLLEEVREDALLLRQALEALEQGAWDTLRGRNAAYAIRERLGEKDETERRS